MTLPDFAHVRPDPQPAPLPVSPRLVADRIAAELNEARCLDEYQAFGAFDVLWMASELIAVCGVEALAPYVAQAEARRRVAAHARRTR